MTLTMRPIYLQCQTAATSTVMPCEAPAMTAVAEGSWRARAHSRHNITKDDNGQEESRSEVYLPKDDPRQLQVRDNDTAEGNWDHDW